LIGAINVFIIAPLSFFVIPNLVYFAYGGQEPGFSDGRFINASAVAVAISVILIERRYIQNNTKLTPLPKYLLPKLIVGTAISQFGFWYWGESTFLGPLCIFGPIIWLVAFPFLVKTL
jgi:hypothetical protein